MVMIFCITHLRECNVKVLRAEDKCDLVIALTHMRIHNDTKLANACPGIDLSQCMK